MRDLIMGFYQAELIKTNLDLTDLVILKYIADANVQNSMAHFEDENNIRYVWLAHSKFHEDLPFLKMAESTLKARLSNLKKDGWLGSITKRYQGGSTTFYATTEKYNALLCISENIDNDNSTRTENNTCTSIKNNTCARTENNTCENVENTDILTRTENNTCARIKNSTCTGIKNNTPDNKLIDNKLIRKEDIISKDIISVENSTKDISENTKTIPFSDTKTKRVRRERVVDTVTEKKDEQPKKKKRNRYEQFMDVVDEYTEDEKLRELLKEYAVVRLEKSKEDGEQSTFYASKFKSIIKHLSELSDDIEEQYKIVQQSIDKRYRILCPLNTKNNYDRQNMIKRGIQMTEPDATSFKNAQEAREYTENLKREYERRGRRAVF